MEYIRNPTFSRWMNASSSISCGNLTLRKLLGWCNRKKIHNPKSECGIAKLTSAVEGSEFSNTGGSAEAMYEPPVGHFFNVGRQALE